MTDENSTPSNPRSFISINALPGEIYQVGWVESTGDLIIRYSPNGVRRLHRMFNIPREILTQHKDSEFDEIKDDVAFCIEFLEHVIETIYEKREVKSNA